jgi:hypothetical protein
MSSDISYGSNGSLSITNFPAVQAVNGSVTVSNLPTNYWQAATVVTSYNITMTTANLPYGQALPAGTKHVVFRNRNAYSTNWLLSTSSSIGPPAVYQTLKTGLDADIVGLFLTGFYLWVWCAQAGQVVELIAYS